MSVESLSKSSVLITHELEQRPCRPPNLEAEVQILRALGQQLTHSSQAILKYLVEAAVELCQAGTAGVSLIETLPSRKEVFRWVALAGVYKPYEGGTTEREFSPCGVCLSRGSTQLYYHPERYFTDLQQADPPIVEELVVPLLLKGQALGTIWIASHDEQRQFDAEDVRILTSLADFTAAALQSSRLRHAAEKVQNELGQRTSELIYINQELEQALEELRVNQEKLRTQNEELAVSSRAVEVERQRYQDLFNFAPDGYFVTDVHGAIQEANQMAIALLDLPKASPVGILLWIFVSEQDRQAYLRYLLQLRKAETVQSCELNLRSQQGRCFPAAISAITTRNREGQIIGLRWMIRDITDLKQAEAFLRESEELKQRILESSQDCIKVLTLDGQLLFMNSGGIHLFEVDDPTSLLNAQWLSFWRGEDSDKALFALSTAKAGNVGRFQGYCPTAKGTSKWWDVIVTPIRDAAGQVVQLLSISRDITEIKRIEAERQQAEMALREAHVQLESAVVAGAVYIWRWNIKSDQVIVNTAFAHLFAVDPATTGLPIEVFINAMHEDDRERVVAAINQAIETGDEYNAQYRVQTATGETRWVTARGRVEYDETRKPIAFPGALVDITEQKQREGELAALREQLAHDLADMTRLHEVSTQLLADRELEPLLQEILETAIAVLHADMGNLQVYDPHTQTLKIVAQSGFDSEFLDFFDTVTVGQATCGTAIGERQRVIVEDIKTDPCFEPLRLIAKTAGYRAVQSIPLLGQRGEPLGVLSTHFRQPHRSSEQELRLLDLYARQAAALIERKQAEQTLRESEELKQRILENSQDCIKVLTLDGEILYMNRGGLCLLEIDEPTSVLNVDWVKSFWQGEDYEKAEAALSTARAGKIGQFQGYCPTMKGKPKWWDSVISPIRDELGNVVQLVVISRDITKQKQAEVERERLLQREQAAREEAESANRIKDEFLAVLSHELRSPLNPILGWSNLLRTGRLDAEKTAHALETIERNAKLQVQLIEDLLDVSRILRGKLKLNIAPVNLAAIIRAALETVQLAAEAKGIEVRFEVKDDGGEGDKQIRRQEVGAKQHSPFVPLQILGDSARLQQIIWNLLTNAVKFTPTGGRVEVRLESCEFSVLSSQLENSTQNSKFKTQNLQSYAQIQVKDTGKGINPDFLPHVFEYFRQADNKTTRKFGGLGLGLAIVHHLVELHGGTVQADSLGEGQGATFTVSFPLLRAANTQIQDEQDSSSRPTSNLLPLAGLRVLLVDDDTDTRDLITFTLEQSGALVTAVSSAIEALQAFERTRFDVLMSDIGMPETDGYMLIRQIRAMPPKQGGGILAIALSAYAGESDQQQAILAGFQRHIAKPVEPEKVVKVVSSLATSLQT